MSSPTLQGNTWARTRKRVSRRPAQTGANKSEKSTCSSMRAIQTLGTSQASRRGWIAARNIFFTRVCWARGWSLGGRSRSMRGGWWWSGWWRWWLIVWSRLWRRLGSWGSRQRSLCGRFWIRKRWREVWIWRVVVVGLSSYGLYCIGSNGSLAACYADVFLACLVLQHLTIQHHTTPLRPHPPRSSVPRPTLRRLPQNPPLHLPNSHRPRVHRSAPPRPPLPPPHPRGYHHRRRRTRTRPKIHCAAHPPWPLRRQHTPEW